MSTTNYTKLGAREYMFTTEDTEVKTKSAYVCGDIRIQTLTQCIIFISFMYFMVRQYLSFLRVSASPRLRVNLYLPFPVYPC